MANLSKRLNIIESALMPQPEEKMLIRITRAGREIETPIAYTHHKTGETYSVDDARFDELTGLHIFFAEYAD